ncbi:MFS transporter [Variovorax paradoxus]|uniref:Major facilitator superfamily MFS_1 n=1 Tax=Variovorax paradoxus (strain EPS) TaxID=595537 RepID=E6VBD1_VARPE|nr:MFS transporter [Variovorax paradoxus]ADU38661.1 major facilitator superfamily MFS_1 [Variovorax paradoxus EPS]
MTHSPLSPSYSPRHRWKVLAAGVAANAAFSVAFSGIPMTAVLMRTGYQLDNATLGLVLGLMGLGIAVSELPWGLLTDRWGDRPVLLTGLGSTAIALVAMALWAAPSGQHIPGLGWLAAGLLLVGLLGGSVNGASGRAVMTWFDASERGLAMSIRQTAVPLGGGIGALVLPFVALHFGFAALYGLLALLCALSALMSWAWVQEPPIAKGAPRAPTAAEAPKTGPLRDARVWRIVLGIGILCAPQFAVLSFGTVFLHDFGHAGLATITATMVFTQVGAMVMRVWSGRWTDRRRNRPAYLRACSALSVLLFAALAVLVMAAGTHTADSLALRIALVVLLGVSGVCVSAWHGVAYTELATLAGAARAGTALGMANTSVFLVCFVTPFSIPHLLALQGWPMVWLTASACALVAMPLLVPRPAAADQNVAKTALSRST